MQRNDDRPQDELLDLGAFTSETKGTPDGLQDDAGGPKRSGMSGLANE